MRKHTKFVDTGFDLFEEAMLEMELACTKREVDCCERQALTCARFLLKTRLISMRTYSVLISNIEHSSIVAYERIDNELCENEQVEGYY